jgi:hypothetical protein
MSGNPGAGPAQTFKLETKEVAPGEPAPFVESEPVGEIVVDGLANAMLAGGLLRLAMFVDRADVVTGRQTRPIVCRLALTPEAAQNLSAVIKATLDKMVSDRKIPALPPPPVAEAG